MFVQVLGYGATAAICLYLVLNFILKWRIQERARKSENGENGNGARTIEMSRLVSTIVQPMLAETTEKLEKAIEEHHDFVRDRNEQVALTLQQITQIQSQQIDTLKELTRVVRAVLAQQGRFFDAIASLDRFGKLLVVKRREEDSSHE